MHTCDRLCRDEATMAAVYYLTSALHWACIIQNRDLERSDHEGSAAQAKSGGKKICITNLIFSAHN